MTTITDAMQAHYKRLAAQAEDEVARLHEALSFTTGQRDGCRAEVKRLREDLAYNHNLQTLYHTSRAEVVHLRKMLAQAVSDKDDWRQLEGRALENELKQQARAEVAEAEVARLRSRVAQLETELEMTVNALRVTQDSVFRNMDRADAAEDKVARLRKTLRIVQRKLARDERMAALDAVDEALADNSDQRPWPGASWQRAHDDSGQDAAGG